MDKPSILYIMTDQQRFDTIAALGHSEVYTPNLDRLVRRGVSTGEWKYVRSDPHPLLDVDETTMPEVSRAQREDLHRERLYRLPREDRDVLAQHPAVARRMRALLERHLAQASAPRPAGAAPLDDDVQLRLRALGYGE